MEQSKLAFGVSGLCENYAFLPAFFAAQRAFMLAASLALPSGVSPLCFFTGLAFLVAVGALATDVTGVILETFLAAFFFGVATLAGVTTDASGTTTTLAPFTA